MLCLGYAFHGAPYRTALATPGRLQLLTIVAALLLIAFGGLLLALGERRLSRTLRDAEPATPRPAVPTVQDQALPPSTASAVHVPRAATAG